MPNNRYHDRPRNKSLTTTLSVMTISSSDEALQFMFRTDLRLEDTIELFGRDWLVKEKNEFEQPAGEIPSEFETVTEIVLHLKVPEFSAK